MTAPARVVAESLNAIRIVKTELARFTDKWMLRMRGRGIKNDSNGFWPKQTKRQNGH